MNINTDVSSILLNQLTLTNQSSNVTTVKQAEKSTEKNSPGVTANTIQDSVNLSSASIDNFRYVTEENLISGLDLIQATNDALDEMRSNLSFLRQVLRESENYGDEYGTLIWLDEQSDLIIDTILDIFNNTEYNGVKVFSGEQSYSSNAILDNYKNFVFSLGSPSDTTSNLIINTKINLDGLLAIRGLNLDDENYETKIDEVLTEINQKREELFKKKDILETIAQSIFEEDMYYDDNIVDISSQDIQAQILNNTSSTLASVIQELSAENILQFLSR